MLMGQSHVLRTTGYAIRETSLPQSMGITVVLSLCMLNHPHCDEADLLTVDSETYDSFEKAYAHCSRYHRHPPDHYGDVVVEPEPDEFEENPYIEEEIEEEIWQ